MRRLTGEEFGRHFETFKTSARRRESLQYFATDEDAFNAWQRGEPIQHDPDWAAIIQAAKDRGARFERIRLVVEPLNPYVQWELRAYDPGEEVLVLAIDSDSPRMRDVWVFDDRIAVWMVYDADGRFLYGEEDRAAPALIHQLDALAYAAAPLARYLAAV